MYTVKVSLINQFFRIFSIVLLILISTGAFAAGYSFITDPSGNGIGMSTEYLKYSPFDNYFIPGLILILCNGILSLVTLIFVLRGFRYHSLLLLFQGCLLTGWIIIQVMMVHDFNLLHLFCLLTGIFWIVAGFLLL